MRGGSGGEGEWLLPSQKISTPQNQILEENSEQLEWQAFTVPVQWFSSVQFKDERIQRGSPLSWQCRRSSGRPHR